jgi:hypothetical protein
VRLADTGGALGAAEIRPSNLLPPPRRGTRILVRGHICYDPTHGWYAIDPVDAWFDAGAHDHLAVRTEDAEDSEA